MSSPISVVLAGGGTAGHISPMISMARALERQNVQVNITMVGTATGMETTLIPAAGYELKTIDRVPFPRRPSLDLLKLPGRLAGAVRQARAVIDEAQADVVVGVGGYVSTPFYVAARRAQIPVVVHEGNVRPGMANRVGARGASVVATAFPETKLRHAQHVGMPLSTEITGLQRTPANQAKAREKLGLDPHTTTVVVTGGSSGALSLNNTVRDALPAITATGAQVLHLTGRGKTVLDSQGIPLQTRGYHQMEYLDGLADAYAAADVVICRAGGGTVCELAALGVPSILVPLPIGNGEQMLNGRGLTNSGGALMVSDSEFTPQWAHRELPPLLADPTRLQDMSAAARTLGIRDADEIMAQLILNAATPKTTIGRNRD